jgi:hypothetical protein
VGYEGGSGRGGEREREEMCGREGGGAGGGRRGGESVKWFIFLGFYRVYYFYTFYNKKGTNK